MTNWHMLSTSPNLHAAADGKWGDFKGSKLMHQALIEVPDEDKHAVQLDCAVMARKKMGLSNAEAKDLLSALGIDKRIDLDGTSKGD